jgi:hypothetical protein
VRASRQRRDLTERRKPAGTGSILAEGVIVEEHDERAVGDLPLPPLRRLKTTLAHDAVAKSGLTERDVLPVTRRHRRAESEDSKARPCG